MKLLKKVGHRMGQYFASVDKWLMLLCILLSSISVVFLFGLYKVGTTNMSRATTQLLATLVGLGIAVIISLIDYKVLIQFWKLYVPLCVVLVALTFFVGVERGSNRAWLAIPFFGGSKTIQPSEFLKIAFITTFALHIDSVQDHLNKLITVLGLGLHGGAYMLLIVLQKDSGTALVFLFMMVIMLFLAGLSWKYIAAGALLLIPATPVLWYKVMSLDQQMRFLVLKDPSVSPRYAYQQAQGLKALGLGGIQGTGFSGKHVYVPESYNDFIFTFIGETAGLIGCLAIIVLILLLCYRILSNGNHADDEKGRMICIGVMAMILVQSIMNIGMCINVLPVIGVTLPFLSSGGTSVVSMYAGIGLVLSVYRHNQQGLFGRDR